MTTWELIFFLQSPSNHKTLIINLAKYVHNFQAENYKTVIKQIENLSK